MVSNLGIPAQQILGISFTNKAAKEMKDRVMGLLGRHRSKGITLCTFHSLGVKILRQDIEKLGYHPHFSIFDSSDQLSIVKEALKTYKGGKEFKKEWVLSKIGLLKNACIDVEQFLSSHHFDPESPYDLATAHVYEFYQEKLRFYNAIDFDDILFLTVKLFKQYPEIAQKYSDLYKYIMIDEYQDTNNPQFELTLGLTSNHKNLCVVGDDDQSIYAFRGADVTNILHFEKNFPQAKIIKLEENYRSTMPILNLANQVIKDNSKRRDKTLWSQKSSNNLPVLWAMADSDHEAQVVVDEIAKYQAQGKNLANVAVLYRSNTQTQTLEDELRLNKIPYKIIGGQKLYERKEIKDLIAYLCLIQNIYDELALRRIINVPARGVGLATLNKFIEKQKEHLKQPLFATMEAHPDIASKSSTGIQQFCLLIRKFQTIFQSIPLHEALAQLIQELDFISFIEKNESNLKMAQVRKNNVASLLMSAERFVRYNHGQNILKDFIERILLQDSQDQQNEDDQEDGDVRKNQVTLMTLHSSKGLEFDQVYIVGMEEELLPHKKTISNNNDISEERRLCYVGITRAKERLYMTYCKERKIYAKNIKRFKSRFLEGKDDYFLHQDRTTFGHMAPEEAQEYKSQFFSNLLSQLDK